MLIYPGFHLSHCLANVIKITRKTWSKKIPHQFSVGIESLGEEFNIFIREETLKSNRERILEIVGE